MNCEKCGAPMSEEEGVCPLCDWAPGMEEETVPQEETPAQEETPVDLFAQDGETELFEAEGAETLFADEADEAAAPAEDAGKDPGEAPGSAKKGKGPGVAAGLAAGLVAAVVAFLVVNMLFGPKRAASPADKVLELVECLPDNETDVALETVGIAGKTTLLNVEGVDVTAEEYLYWLGNITSYYDMISSFSGSAMDLTQEAQPGVTWDEQLKLAARDNSVLLALTPALAREFGVELTQEELQDVADGRASAIESAGGETMYAYQLQAMGINDSTALRTDAISALYNKVQIAWRDKLAQELTGEAVAAYVEENDILRAKHILLLTRDMATGEPYDEETAAQQRAKADDLLAQLRADPTKFDQLMNDNSEDSGLADNPEGYLFTAGQMVSEFENGTRALALDEISDIVESDYGYHIILRLDPDCEELRESIAGENFNAAVQERVDNAKVTETEAYQSITTADYYEKLLAFQKALPYPEAEDQSQPDVVDQSGAALEPAS